MKPIFFYWNQHRVLIPSPKTSHRSHVQFVQMEDLAQRTFVSWEYPDVSTGHGPWNQGGGCNGTMELWPIFMCNTHTTHIQTGRALSIPLQLPSWLFGPCSMNTWDPSTLLRDDMVHLSLVRRNYISMEVVVPIASISPSPLWPIIANNLTFLRELGETLKVYSPWDYPGWKESTSLELSM